MQLINKIVKSDLKRQCDYTITLPQYRLNGGAAYEEIFFSISRYVGI